MAKKKCVRIFKKTKEGIHYTNPDAGFHAKVSKKDEGYSVMEYVGNVHFPAMKPTWKNFKKKSAAIKEAKKYINRYC